jgi:hypothetical protein
VVASLLPERFSARGAIVSWTPLVRSVTVWDVVVYPLPEMSVQPVFSRSRI